jgi:hypothetical protein
MDNDVTLVLWIVHWGLRLLASIYALGLAALLFYGLYCALAERRTGSIQKSERSGPRHEQTSSEPLSST